MSAPEDGVRKPSDKFSTLKLVPETSGAKLSAVRRVILFEMEGGFRFTRYFTMRITLAVMNFDLNSFSLYNFWTFSELANLGVCII